MESEIKTRIRTLLESQEVLQSKVLVEKLKKEKDITGLITPQWLPLVTDTKYVTSSKLTAFVHSEDATGLGSVLLNQVPIKHTANKPIK